MKIKNFENNSVLKNKIEGSTNNELLVDPERGGIIISMKLDDKEILYMDEERFNDPDKSNRGGIPILYPMSGPPTKEGPFSTLSQHGFARDSKLWRIKNNNDNKLIETLESNDETKEIFPYDFELRMKAEMGEEGDITLTQEVENTGTNEMPVSMGLHPYFNIPEGNKNEVKFDFDGREDIENDLREWLEDSDRKDEKDFLRKIDNPNYLEKKDDLKEKGDHKNELKISIPNTGTIIINASPEYQKIWIWTERDKDFICIEPVMRDNQNGEIVNGPEMVKSDETYSANMNIRLE